MAGKVMNFADSPADVLKMRKHLEQTSEKRRTEHCFLWSLVAMMFCRPKALDFSLILEVQHAVQLEVKLGSLRDDVRSGWGGVRPVRNKTVTVNSPGNHFDC